MDYGQLKVLIVDDVISASKVMESMLLKQNYQVLLAKNAHEALKILENNHDIKVILMDYAMPEMDGIALTLKIREKYSKDKISIIGISGVHKHKLNSDFMKNGANDFIVKPFTYDELLCRVNQNVDMIQSIEYNRNLANFDYLTKVYNRRYFFTNGKILYESAKINMDSLSLCMIDIDHFKKINDIYGHDCGDVVLKHFAKILNEYFADYLVARLGGEEFAVLFDNIEYQKVLELLKNFRQLIENISIDYEQNKVSMTVSIGANNILSEDIDAMLKLSDENLYQAKDSGRNKVVG